MDIRDATSDVLPGGVLTEKVANLKRRLRAHYYRRITVKGGEMVWTRTELLPADMTGREHYLSKGFRLDPPEGTEWSLNNTVIKEAQDKAKREAEAKAEAEATVKAETENKAMLETLYAEIASLRASLAEEKGKQDARRKGGRPKKEKDVLS